MFRPVVTPIIDQFLPKDSHIHARRRRAFIPDEDIRRAVNRCYPENRYPPREIAAVIYNWVNYGCFDAATPDVTLNQILEAIAEYEKDNLIVVKIAALIHEWGKGDGDWEIR